MKSIRKVLSLILCMSMIICSTLPSFANENDLAETTSESKIVEQLKIDLGEEKAEEIIGSSVDESEIDDSNIESEEINQMEIEKETLAEPEEETEAEAEIEAKEDITSTENEEADTTLAENEAEADTTSTENEEKITLTEAEESATESIVENATEVVDELESESAVESEDNGKSDEDITNNEDVEEFVETVANDSQIASESGNYGVGDTWMWWYLTDDGHTMHFTGVEPDASFNAREISNSFIYFSGLNKSDITSVIFEDAITAQATSTSSMFTDFTNLAIVDNINNFNTSSITNMSKMFNNCTNLESINISGLDTSSVTDMSRMFAGCSQLNTIDLSGLNLGAVTNMNNMFNGCSQLTGLDLNGLNLSAVTDMGNMFKGCSQLIALDLSSLNLSTVRYMPNMFEGCTSLAAINFSAVNATSVTNIQYMFKDCTSLTTVDFSNFGSSNASISTSNAFENCSSINRLNLSLNVAKEINSARLTGHWKNTNTNKCYDYKNNRTQIPEEAGEYIKVLKLTLDAKGGTALPHIYSEYNSNVTLTNPTRPGFTFDGWYNEDTYETSVTTPLTLTDDKTIYAKWSGGEGATLIYWGISGPNTTPKQLYLSMSEDDINNHNCEFKGSFINTVEFNNETETPWYAFRSEIKKITTAHTNSLCLPFQIKSLAYWFKDMTNLTSVFMPQLAKDNTILESMAHTFEGCTSISSIGGNFRIGDNLRNMNSVCKGCSNLTFFGIFNSDNAIQLDNDGFKDAFAGCTSLKRLLLHRFDFSNYVGDVFTFSNDSAISYISLRDSGNVFSRLNLPGIWIDPNTGHTYEGANIPNNLNIVQKYDPEIITNRIYWYIQGNEVHITNVLPDNPYYVDGHFFDGNQAGYGIFPPAGLIPDNAIIVLDNNIVLRGEGGVGFFGNICESAVEIRNIDKLNTTAVTSMDNMFCPMYNLTSVDLSILDTSNVTNMNLMFQGCSSLTSLDLSHFNTSKVETMVSMFEDCQNLTSINLSHFDTRKAEDMTSMFEDCVSITTLDLSSFSSASLDKDSDYNDGGIWLMFKGCTNLRTIYVSNNFTITYDPDAVVIGNGVFDDCHNLIGGNGTAFSGDHIYADYACIDTVEHPGYFTYKEPGGDEPTPGPEPVTPTLESISISVPPTKVNYEVGEKFNPAGLKITRHYTGGTSTVLTYNDTTKNSFSFNPSLTTALTEEDTYVTITYGGKSVRQNITVTVSKEIASISVIKKPNKITYTAGTYLNPRGLTIRVYYVDNTTEDVAYNSGTSYRFTFNPTLRTRLAVIDNQVAVTYKGKTATFSITVTRNGGGDVPGGGGESNRPSGGGGGGSSGSGPIPAANMQNLTPATTHLQVLKHIVGTVDSSLSSWSADPNTGKFRLNIVDATGQIVNATNGFYQINQNTTQNVNGVEVQVPVNNTYYFDAGGYMVTGWIQTADNKWYFFENAKTNDEGKMQIGWKQIQGVWYFFGIDGTMYQNQTTPDGFTVDANGALVQA